MEIEPSIQITSSVQGDYVVVHVSGRVDTVTSETLEKEIQQHVEGGCTRMVLDCQGLKYMPSAGLRVLLMTLKAFQERNGSLTLAALSENILDILSVSGFLKLFTVVDTVEEAVT